MSGLLLATALFVCPAGGVIDRIEGERAVVLGSTGVRIVARRDLLAFRRRAPREGDRLAPGPLGSCMAFPPVEADIDALRGRLRALAARPDRASR